MAIVKAKYTGANAVGNDRNMLVITGMDADVALTAQEAADVGILDTTLTAAKSVVFPTAIKGKVLIVKNTTGATHAVTVKVAGQTGIAVAATKVAMLYCDGTDFVRVTADA